MSKTVKLLATLSFLALVAACGNQAEEVAPADEMSSEPVFTGKFG